MEQDELLERFEKEFKAMKKELKFKASLEDIEGICYISDIILGEGYVPKYLSRIVCKNIMETFKSWGNYFHGVLLPNPHSMISINESRIFDEKDKKEFRVLMSQIMVFSSRNALNGMANDKLSDGKLIYDTVKFWNETLKPKAIEVLKKVNKKWSEKPEEQK